MFCTKLKIYIGYTDSWLKKTNINLLNIALITTDTISCQI